MCCALTARGPTVNNTSMTEALAAPKWQDRREAWEALTDTDGDALAARLAKETNGAVLDAALDAIARLASSDLAPVLPHVIQKGLANARGATGRRGLKAVRAMMAAAPDATTDALVDGLAASKNARGPAACAKTLTTECPPRDAWLADNGDRLAAAVATLAAAPSGAERAAAWALAASVDAPAVYARLPPAAKKAVDKLRGDTPPAAGPPPPPGSPPKRVAFEVRKEPSPERAASPLVILAKRGIAPPFDAVFGGKWDERRARLEAVAEVVQGASSDLEELALAVAQACEAEPHAAVAKSAVQACAAVAGGAGGAGRRALVAALLPRLRDAKLAQHTARALAAVASVQPEVVFDDTTVRAAADALAAGAKRRLPPAGRAAGFRWAAAAFAASPKAPAPATKAWAALAAADAADAHAPLRAAAQDALASLVARPRADVKTALASLDNKTRARVLERHKGPAPAAAPAAARRARPKAAAAAPDPAPLLWPPAQVTARPGVVPAADVAPTSLRATLRAPSEQRRAKALAELLKRAAGPGGALDAREGEVDRVLRELRPLVADARAALRAPACDAAAAWLDRVQDRDAARRLAGKTGIVLEAAAAVVDAGALTAYRASALRLLQACGGKRCGSSDALRLDEGICKAVAKALATAAGAGCVALLHWLAKHATACDAGDALAISLVTRLYDKARAPRDAAASAVTALVRSGALDRPALDAALAAAPSAGKRVVGQLLDAALEQAPVVAVPRAAPPVTSPLPAVFDFGAPVVEPVVAVAVATPAQAFAAVERAVAAGDGPALRAAAAAAAALAAAHAPTFDRATCALAMRAALKGADVAARDAAARESLDAVARAAALDAPRSRSVAAALDLLRAEPDRCVANHLARLLTLGLRDPAWGAALDRGEGDALQACAETFDAVSAAAPSLALDAAKTVAAAAVDRIGADVVVRLSCSTEDAPMACLVRALAGAPPSAVEVSSPSSAPLAGASGDVAALRRRCAAARVSLGSARSNPDSAGKDRIAALRTRLAVAARTPAVPESCEGVNCDQ